MSEANASDHPDIIWVNKYPNSGMYVHRSKEEAVLRRGEHTNATAAYQRLPDGVDPETHEQVESWSSFFDVAMAGWRPKPQPEPPYVPAPKDIFEVDGVRYQRKCPTEDFNIFMAWDFSLADEVRFRTKDIESGDVVCVPIPQVEADE